MQKYRVIFFDLDHTLWDYNKNAGETLNDLYHHYDLDTIGGFDMSTFEEMFHKVNHSLWNSFNKGQIDKEFIRKERFNRILKRLNIHQMEDVALKISEDYINSCPTKPHLLPHTYEVLDYLKKRYELYLLTNGFDDVQKIKIRCSKIDSYFKAMITSETTGHRKPSREIFDHALEVANASNDNTIMVGDNIKTDIIGAKNASIDAVYLNPDGVTHNESIKFEISNLRDLMDIL